MGAESPYRGREARDYEKGKREAGHLQRQLEEMNRRREPVQSGGCFVATAVFGNEGCDEVVTLRRFRDERLLSSNVGRGFVRVYYSVGPQLARYVKRSRVLIKIFKVALALLCRYIGSRDRRSASLGGE